MDFKYKSSEIALLLGIDSNLLEYEPIVSIENNVFVVTIYIKDDNPRMCPICGSTNVRIKEKINQILKYDGLLSHFNIENGQLLNKCELHIFKRRYFCLNCKHSFRQKDSICSFHKKISNNVIGNICYCFKQYLSFTDIAKRFNLSITSVMNIFDERIKIGRLALPEIMCIDEIKFNIPDLTKYICVISSYTQRKIVDIAKMRTYEFLVNYFLNLPYKELKNVKVFISDMNITYKKIHDDIFSNSIHVIDRFHVTELFTRSINKERNKITKTYGTTTFDSNFLKTKWRLFLKNKDDIIDSEKLDKTADKYSTVVEIMLRIIYANKALYDLRYTYQLYLRMTDELTLDEASYYLRSIITVLESSTSENARIIGKTLKVRKTQILNYYGNPYGKKLSNSVAEAMNSKLNKLIVIARGLGNFERMRKRILYIDRG